MSSAVVTEHQAQERIHEYGGCNYNVRRGKGRVFDMHCRIALVLMLFAVTAAPALASRPIVYTDVPIERLLNNLEHDANTPRHVNDLALLEFQIGRLHEMAFAMKTVTETVKTTNGTPGVLSIPRNFAVRPSRNAAEEAMAQQHLREAIRHLKKAVALLEEAKKTPRDGFVTSEYLLLSRLGLAWCLLQERKDSEAIAAYWQVFVQAFEASRPERTDNSFRDRDAHIAREAGLELKEALRRTSSDPSGLHDLELKLKKLPSTTPGPQVRRLISPIVIPLTAATKPSQLLQNISVKFDLDGLGKRPFAPWPTVRAGWLVYDVEDNHRITSGLQLFGNVTFWVFWRDGYKALSALDDNHDGRLSGAELRGLAVWLDKDSNGVSEAGEVKPLKLLGIKSLAVVSKMHPSGVLYSPHGVTFSSGVTRPTYDFVLTDRSRGNSFETLAWHRITATVGRK